MGPFGCDFECQVEVTTRLGRFKRRTCKTRVTAPVAAFKARKTCVTAPVAARQLIQGRKTRVTAPVAARQLIQGPQDSRTYTPISEDTLIMVCWLFCHGCVVQSLNGFLFGVESFCRSEGLPMLPEGMRFKQARTGIQNIFGQVDIPSPVVGLTVKDLLRLRAGIDFRKLADVRFWCQVLLGFQGFFAPDR